MAKHKAEKTYEHDGFVITESQAEDFRRTFERHIVGGGISPETLHSTYKPMPGNLIAYYMSTGDDGSGVGETYLYYGF